MNELLTTAEMADADRRAIASGIASLTLMENAGRAVAGEAAKMVRPGARIAVLCGPGNNGGDGFVAARLMREAGNDVAVALLGELAALSRDAAAMAERWSGAIEPLTSKSVANADLIIDAIFGAGLNRPAPAVIQEIADAAAARGVPVLAVDVPSGLDATSGVAHGPVLSAARTITFFRKKLGHVLLPGRQYCGEVVVADIGLPDAVLADIKPQTIENTLASWIGAMAWPRLDGHKYHRGHAVVVSGPPHQTGAARLGARGALRIGAGLVTVASPPASLPINAAHLTAIMLQPVASARALSEFLDDTRKNSVLIGPGFGPAFGSDVDAGADTREWILAALTSSAAVVLDADALSAMAENSIVGDAAPGFGFTSQRPVGGVSVARIYAEIAARPSAAVLTPHDGEFARMFPSLSGNRLVRARTAAARSGAIVVLKGADTIIAHPDGRAAVNSNAPPWLATAGSGDVLAGFICGLLAQGMSGYDASRAAVWLHGEVATLCGVGLIAEDLPERLPEILRSVFEATAAPRGLRGDVATKG